MYWFLLVCDAYHESYLTQARSSALFTENMLLHWLETITRFLYLTYTKQTRLIHCLKHHRTAAAYNGQMSCGNKDVYQTVQ